MSVHFWETLCFILMLGLIYRPVKKFINAYLDEHSNHIYKTILDAEHLREDAAKSIEFYKQQHQKFAMQADAMTKATDENIAKLAEAHADLLHAKIEAKKILYDEKVSIYTSEEYKKLESALVSKSLIIAQMYLKDNSPQSVTQKQMREALNLAKAKKLAVHH